LLLALANWVTVPSTDGKPSWEFKDLGDVVCCVKTSQVWLRPSVKPTDPDDFVPSNEGNPATCLLCSPLLVFMAQEVVDGRVSWNILELASKCSFDRC
jgi:hypothetical protein